MVLQSSTKKQTLGITVSIPQLLGCHKELKTMSLLSLLTHCSHMVLSLLWASSSVHGTICPARAFPVSTSCLALVPPQGAGASLSSVLILCLPCSAENLLPISPKLGALQ